MWLKSHIIKLPDFVEGAVDFGALAGVSSFAHVLRCKGCAHVVAIQKENINFAADVGESTSSVRRSVRNFISSFWAKFGWAEVRNMAEARRISRLVGLLLFLLYVFCSFCNVALFGL